MATTHRVLNLLIILIPFVGLFLAMVFFWGWGFTWIHLAIFLSMYLLTGLGVTIGYHRHFTHKSFDAHPAVRVILGVLGSMALEGPINSWVCIHRRHHQHSDQAGDPHTPYDHDHHSVRSLIKGFWTSHMGWMLVPKGTNDYARYIPDLEADPVVRWVSRLFPVWAILSLLIPAALAGILTMSWSGALLGLLWGGLVRILMVQHITWSVNSICHIWGTKPYKSNDESRNNPIVGVLALGEGWHNNHHAFPTSARHGLRWWQFDISYITIKVMEKLGLVWNVRVPTPERLASKRVDQPS